MGNYRRLMACVFVFGLAGWAVAEENQLKAFPDPDEGVSRYVIDLEEKADESRYRVELIVGKTVQTDSKNRYFFGGTITAKTVEGWGYTRYVVERLGPMAGTLIGVAPDDRVDRFITLGGEPYLIRYNSKLPVVVYVPDDAEVRYRIWSAPREMSEAEQG